MMYLSLFFLFQNIFVSYAIILLGHYLLDMHCHTSHKTNECGDSPRQRVLGYVDI